MSSYLIEIDTNIGTTYLTTTQVDVTHNANTYQSGYIDKPPVIKQTPNIQSNSLTLTLSGVDDAMISLFTNEDYRNRELRIIECDVATDWTVSNASEVFSAFMVKVGYEIGLTETLVELTVKSLYGSINQSNAPKCGVVYDKWITDDKTVYFGKVGPVTGGGRGKPGGQIDFDIVEQP